MSTNLRVLGREESGPITGSWTDRSGTIITGGTAQDVAAINYDRCYLLFQNHSDTDMWLNFDVDAVADQPSIKVPAGYTYVPSFVHFGRISVLCVTTGQAFTCKEG